MEDLELVVSPWVEIKIKEFHSVSVMEVEEALCTFTGKLHKETQAEHQTIPPTYWFISETMEGRELFIAIKIEGNKAFLKTAYEID